MGSGRARGTPSPIAKTWCRFTAFLACTKLYLVGLGHNANEKQQKVVYLLSTNTDKYRIFV